MRVRFLHSYGVFVKGKVYEVPHPFAVELIRKLHCVKVLDAPRAIPNKAMRPSQVSHKGGL